MAKRYPYKKFECAICKDCAPKCTVLHPTKRGGVCIHCVEKYSLKIISLSNKDFFKKRFNSQKELL